jgi:hypothetical protein
MIKFFLTYRQVGRNIYIIEKHSIGDEVARGEYLNTVNKKDIEPLYPEASEWNGNAIDVFIKLKELTADYVKWLSKQV